MEHSFKYLKEEADNVCSGNPMKPTELESIMRRYNGACDEMKEEIEEFLSIFGKTCRLIARTNFGINI